MSIFSWFVKNGKQIVNEAEAAAEWVVEHEANVEVAAKDLMTAALKFQANDFIGSAAAAEQALATMGIHFAIPGTLTAKAPTVAKVAAPVPVTTTPAKP